MKIYYKPRFYYRKPNSPEQKFLWLWSFYEAETENEAVAFAQKSINYDSQGIINYYPGYVFAGFDIFERNSAGSHIKSRHHLSI